LTHYYKGKNEMKYELTEQEANIILKALSEMPFKVSCELIPKIQNQFQEGQKLPETVKKP